MKTIREVCQIVGVTRRTLQEYDRIGLLSPTNKETRTSSNDVWLYSDQDIWKLIEIQIFIAARWKRKEIKEMYSRPDFDMVTALESSITRLQEEKEKISRRIQILRHITENIDYNSLQNKDPAELFAEHSFREQFERSSSTNSSWEQFLSD